MLFEESDLLKELPEQFFAGLVAKVNAKVAEGADIINLGQGNPDQPTYDHIVEALRVSAKNPANHKYSQFRGNRPFKEAAASVICYDIRFPEWVRTQMAQGAKVLFVVAQWPEPRVQQWEILLKARAVENQAFVVAVNRVGTGSDDVFSGHSMVIDPLGNVVLQSKEHEEGIFTADINLEEVDKVRGQIPVFEDRRTDLYH